MNNINKGKSPFYPGQPVPTYLFIGRIKEIQRIARAAHQIELGKPQAVFLQGEYGIGKSSLASYMRHYAEEENHLLGIHVFLGNAKTPEELATKTVEAIAKIDRRSALEKIRSFLSKYIGKQELFGVSLNFEALKADGPNISRGFLPFLSEFLKKAVDNEIKGLLLIFDEINGISANSDFAHFIKSLVDENALSSNPIPLFLMLCGVEERRREMIERHRPIERIFDIVDIEPMNEEEMRDFFTKAFDSVGMQIKNDRTMSLLCHYSGGFPKIMHLIGDNIFWIDKDNIIDEDDASIGIAISADYIGKIFVDQQVYKALHSKDYRSIFAKLGEQDIDLSFQKSDIEKVLTESEKRKFGNFLQRMKKLNVLKSGIDRGEYVFNSRLVNLYIRLSSIEKTYHC
jgi:hypothetical protein